MIFRHLATVDRCENWNLVSPTPYLPFIREAVRPLFAEGIRLPFVWNSSGYECVETLEEYREFCDANGIKYTEHTDFSQEVINSSDIIYMTRVQRERFADIMEYERVKDLYNLCAAMLSDAKPSMRVLHPLPRVTEIDQDVDDDPHAYYFDQARNGLYARQAIICRALGIDIYSYDKGK